MLEIKDIEKLARLARINLTDEEKESFLKEIDPILGYVAQLKEVSSTVSGEKKAGEHRNIIREDSGSSESGLNTDVIVANMPESQNNYLKVKKIM
ncbi:MAG: Asp-tRNA(Asn)/Glu-tRNA(Gln) amidotransferase subunit GatC [Candidatus Paceibacterota bacterium]|jgi:aspartyl-tRNA(Asn)/glutamyl-tRNA(Gln) amidotransferase subunit C